MSHAPSSSSRASYSSIRSASVFACRSSERRKLTRRLHQSRLHAKKCSLVSSGIRVSYSVHELEDEVLLGASRRQVLAAQLAARGLSRRVPHPIRIVFVTNPLHVVPVASDRHASCGCVVPQEVATLGRRGTRDADVDF